MPSGPWCALPVEKEQRWLPRLAPQLPLPIPVPGAQGEPADGYPYPWSVYGWLDGDVAMHAEIADLTAFATAVAGFLAALRGSTRRTGPARASTTSSAAMRAWEDAVAAPTLGVDDATWSRGRGWALWKATDHAGRSPAERRPGV